MGCSRRGRYQCLLQPMAGRHQSVTLRNGQAMAGSPITGSNVTLSIQIGIDTPVKPLGLDLYIRVNEVKRVEALSYLPA